MSSEYAIRARGLGKCYALFDRPSDRLKQLLWGRWRQYSRDFWALRDVSFDIPHGEVVGLVGRNGAGKSTLLQMVCGTLAPTSGSIEVNGRVAALLELGAGFSPDFSGLENVYMNAAILGLTRAEVDQRLDGILSFADIGGFIHQPVKTYSSGMFVRLAFAVATSVDPDILVIDEALSVGDGAFARKSFDRIMALKEGGATILFCSHAMYHVHALCSRAIWMQGGQMRMLDTAAKVTAAYETALVVESADGRPATVSAIESIAPDAGSAGAGADSGARPEEAAPPPEGSARLAGIEASADGVVAQELAIHSGKSRFELRIRFRSDPALPCPSVAVGFVHASGVVVFSVLSANDGVVLQRDGGGAGEALLVIDPMLLLKGDYTLSVYLGCERGLHVYDYAERAVSLRVVQEGLEQGLVTLPHQWGGVA